MLGNSLRTTKKWRNILTAISVSFFVLGTITFTSCESAVQEDSVFAEGLARSAVSVRQATPIGSAADLARIGSDDPVTGLPADGEYVLTTSFALPSDWTPICKPSATPFTGTFDGNGNTITVTGFDDGALAGTDPIGIFSQVGDGTSGGSISNLNVALSVGSVSTPARFVGGVAGEALGGSSTAQVVFNGINISGDLKAAFAGTNQPSPAENGFQIGGVVGRADYAVITKCQSRASITGNADNDNGAYNTSAGGIAGYVLHTNIADSIATGNVNLSGLSIAFDWDHSWQIYAGGLVGYQGVQSTILRSYATGNVNAIAPFPYAGGLVAYNYGYNDFSPPPPPPAQGSSISQSYATGAVSAVAQEGSYDIPYAGGLVGYSSLVDSIIEDSYATGDVTAISDGEYAWAGGVIGGNAYNSVVSRCYATGTITVENGAGTPLYAPDGADAGASAGGIAGCNYYSFDDTAGTIIQYCAALNTRIEGGLSDPALLHRVAGNIGVDTVDYYGNQIYPGKLVHNIANDTMMLSNGAEQAPGYDKLGGEGVRTPVPETVFVDDLRWDFSTVWRMGTIYPVLRWQP